jgi:phage baseplate assembly protein gpV
MAGGISNSGPVRANLMKARGVDLNAPISGRLDVNAQVVGDKTGYSLTAGSYSVRASSTQFATATQNGASATLAVSIASVTTTRSKFSQTGYSTDAGTVTGYASAFTSNSITVTRHSTTGGNTSTSVSLCELF